MAQLPASNFKRILLVGDGSAASENAAWRAGLLAREHGAWLRILHVGRWHENAQAARLQLDALAWRLQERLQVAVIAQSLRGGLRRELTAAGADLVVTHPSQHPMRDRITGLHPASLVAGCDVPVLVVRKAAVMSYQRMLACVREDAQADRCLAAAARMADAGLWVKEAPRLVVSSSVDAVLAQERSLYPELVVVQRGARGDTRPLALPLWRRLLARTAADTLLLPPAGAAPAPSVRAGGLAPPLGGHGAKVWPS